MNRFIDRVLIDVTTRCNLKCIMCGVPHEKEKFDMPIDLYKKIASQTFSNTKELWFSCGYEAFMAKDFIKMLRFTKEIKIPSTTIITNGTLLNKENISAIIEFGLNLIVISIDGATKNIFEIIRKGADFNKVLSNIKLLCHLKKEYRTEIPEIVFIVTLMKRNIKELPQIILLAHRLGIKTVWCKPMRVSFAGLESESIINSKDILLKISREAKKVAERYGVTIGPSSEIETYFADEQNLNGDYNSKDKKQIKCREFSFPVVVIRADGKVYPCSVWKGKPMGDFSNDDFKSIWNNVRYKKLRKKVTSGIFEGECKKCISKKLTEII